MEDFVTYEQAIKLKEFGFDWECTHYYWEKSESLQEYLAKNIDMYHNSWDFNYTEYIDDYTIPSGEHFRENRFEDAYSAPTLAQTQKWLREVKGIHVYSHITSQPELKGKHYWEITSKNGEVLDSVPYIKLVDTYEQALSAGIDKALELLK